MKKDRHAQKAGTTQFKRLTPSCVADVNFDDHRLRSLFSYFKEREELLRLSLKHELTPIQTVAAQAVLHEVESVLIHMVTNFHARKEDR